MRAWIAPVPSPARQGRLRINSTHGRGPELCSPRYLARAAQVGPLSTESIIGPGDWAVPYPFRSGVRKMHFRVRTPLCPGFETVREAPSLNGGITTAGPR